MELESWSPSWSLGETPPAPQGHRGPLARTEATPESRPDNLTLTTLPATHFRPPAAKRRPSDPTADAIRPQDLDCMRSGHFPRRHAHSIEPHRDSHCTNSLSTQSPNLHHHHPPTPLPPNRTDNVPLTQPRQPHKNQPSATSSINKKPEPSSSLPSPQPQPPPQPQP